MTARTGTRQNFINPPLSRWKALGIWLSRPIGQARVDSVAENNF
jgi:hypothetical protein